MYLYVGRLQNIARLSTNECDAISHGILSWGAVESLVVGVGDLQSFNNLLGLFCNVTGQSFNNL